MRSDLAPGGTFPDYELPDHTSTPRRLSELQGDDPLTLRLARPRLPERAPATSGARRVLPEGRRGVHPDRLRRVGLELRASIVAFDATDFGRLGMFFDELPTPLARRPVGAGVHRIGHDGRGFTFDNEGPAHCVFLEPFRLGSSESFQDPARLQSTLGCFALA